MSKEYIERNALLDDLRQSRHELMYVYNSLKHESEKMTCAAELNTFLEIMLRIKDTPAADVAEVVRCKDCKYLYPKDNKPVGFYRCDYKLLLTNLDCFCSEGERSENGDK